MFRHVRWCVVTTVLVVALGAGRVDAQMAASTPVAGPTLAAEQMAWAPEASAPSGDVAALEAGLRRAVRPTYWLTGAIIGGSVLGAAGAVMGAGLCADSDSNHSTGTCVLASLGGAAVLGGVGFAVGALIGGQFNKPAPAAAP